MILKKLVTEKVVEYFKSEQWQEWMRILNSNEETYHAHIYTDSILAPEPMINILTAHFENLGRPLQRKIKILSPGNGRKVANLYGIRPEGFLGHFEFRLQFSDQEVLAPSLAPMTAGEANLAWWDKNNMEEYYQQFNFREFGPSEQEALKAYFKSKDWEIGYYTMLTGRNVHSHNVVRTSLHPLHLTQYGVAAIEERGWKVGGAVSIVFKAKGADVGKITYLLDKPEIILELEWEFDPNTVIEPGLLPIHRIYNEDRVKADLSECNHFVLDEHQQHEIVNALKKL